MVVRAVVYDGASTESYKKAFCFYHLKLLIIFFRILLFLVLKIYPN